jgi:NAD-dependent SIR2 family protein deacetylase
MLKGLVCVEACRGSGNGSRPLGRVVFYLHGSVHKVKCTEHCNASTEEEALEGAKNSDVGLWKMRGKYV